MTYQYLVTCLSNPFQILNYRQVCKICNVRGVRDISSRIHPPGQLRIFINTYQIKLFVYIWDFLGVTCQCFYRAHEETLKAALAQKCML